MEMYTTVQFIGVRATKGRKDPSREYYNMEYRDNGWTRSIGCSVDVFETLKDKKMGSDVTIIVRDYPQRIEGAFGLSRLSCVGVK